VNLSNHQAKFIKYTQMYTDSIYKLIPIGITWATAQVSSPH